jgi:ketol-acid reductoisomerase
VDEGVRERMRQVLAEIQDGTFAEEWLGEAEAGFPTSSRCAARPAAPNWSAWAASCVR